MKKKQKTIPQLKKACQDVFNKYIRLRDKDKPCISCGQFKTLQAGHFYSVRMYDGLRFDEDNCHGECAGCNGFDDMHLIKYSENIQKRIGQQNWWELNDRAQRYKRNGHKWTRSEILELIELYKNKIKEL
jgi:hypothetical protein